LRFKANYLKNNAWLPPFFFVDSNSPCKDLLFPCGLNLAQKPSQLVGTVLKPIRTVFFQVYYETKNTMIMITTVSERNKNCVT